MKLSNYRHPDPDVWLQWCGFVGRNFPEAVKEIALEHCGFSCHRYKQTHLWLQNFRWHIPPEGEGEPRLFADALQGRDSIFPGMLIQGINMQVLKPCDCNGWTSPTEAQTRMAEARYKQALMMGKRVLN